MRYDMAMDVAKIAKLSKLKDPKNKNKFCSQFDSVLQLVSKIQELDLKKIKGTTHALNSKNTFREDKIDNSRILTQEEALSNAKRAHNGYFVVDAVLNSDE